MNPLNIRSGWWVFTDERFVTCYDTKEEAIAHVEYQKSIQLQIGMCNILKCSLKGINAFLINFTHNKEYPKHDLKLFIKTLKNGN